LRNRLAQRHGGPRAAQLQGFDRPVPAGDRPGAPGRREKPEDEVRLLPRAGPDAHERQVGGGAEIVRAGGEARILRPRPVLQSWHRLPQESSEGPGLRSLSEGTQPEGRARAHPGRARKVRPARRAAPFVPPAWTLSEPPPRARALPAAPSLQRGDRAAHLSRAASRLSPPSHRSRPGATFVIRTLVACLIVPAGGALAGTRDDARLDPDAYVKRGYEYVTRPRPEDQAEAERLFRKALRLG